MASMQAAIQVNKAVAIPTPESAENNDLLDLSLTMAALVTKQWITVHQEKKPKTVLPGERTITLDELSWHDHSGDCWIVIYDRVYDVTDFLYEHPGGEDVLLEYAGRDASVAFRGTGHSKTAVKALERHLIGELPMHERIYRNPGGIKLSDLPE